MKLLHCIAELQELHAFHFTAPDVPDRLHGWDFFDLQSEYLRMGVPNENWALTNINLDYEVCRLVLVMVFNNAFGFNLQILMFVLCISFSTYIDCSYVILILSICMFQHRPQHLSFLGVQSSEVEGDYLLCLTFTEKIR